MRAAGTPEISTTIEFCVGIDGAVYKSSIRESSGYTEFDASLLAQIGDWLFEPVVDAGREVPVCSAVRPGFRLSSLPDPDKRRSDP